MAKPEEHYQYAENIQHDLVSLVGRMHSYDASVLVAAIAGLTEATLANARFARRLEVGEVHVKVDTKGIARAVNRQNKLDGQTGAH